MKVAVTGGGGFIGSALMKELEAFEIEAESFDLRNGFDIRQRFDWGDDIDGVIHLAGVLGTHELFDDVQSAIDSNITGTVNVLEACVRTGRRIPYVGITMPPVFPSIYTASKIAAAAFENVYRHEYMIPMMKVRAFNAFGPGQAHGHGHPQKIVPTFAVKAWRREPLPIWGDGKQTIDLIHTDQLAMVLRQALKIAAANDPDRTADVIDGGTGMSMTVNELAELVNAITGSTAGVQHLPMRRGEIPQALRARGDGWGLLNSIPVFTIEQLKDTVVSYKDHPEVSA